MAATRSRKARKRTARNPFAAKSVARRAMPIDALLAGRADYNPRRISPEDFAALKRSLEEFGPVEPAVWNARSDRLVGGHRRVEAAAELGWREYPVEFVDLDDQRERALNLALNRISGQWDDGKLAELLRQMDEASRAVTGFDGDELRALLEGGSLAELNLERARELAAALAGPPKAPEEFGSVDESVVTEHECPKCHYRWSGGK